MTKAFEKRVIKEYIVDTKTYRYKVITKNYKQYIVRLPQIYLDTTRAINGWEIVKEIAE